MAQDQCGVVASTCGCCFFCFKQKAAYEMRISDWSSDVCSSDLGATAFYDIDTPVTAAKLMEGDEEYLSLDLVPQYDLYLSFTGGPLLERIEREFGARKIGRASCRERVCPSV